MTPHFRGIVRTGWKLAIGPTGMLEQYLKGFTVGTILSVVIKPLTKEQIRTLRQNNYLWLIYTALGDHLGYTKDEVHELMGNEFRREPHPTLPGVYRIKSTTEFTIKEMNEYIRNIRIWAIDFLNFSIPDPEWVDH